MVGRSRQIDAAESMQGDVTTGGLTTGFRRVKDIHIHYLRAFGINYPILRPR